MIETLRKVEQRLDRLLEQTRRAVAPSPAGNRELFTHAQAAVRVPVERAFEQHQGTLYNGASSPLVVRRMQVGLALFSTEFSQSFPMYRGQGGWTPDANPIIPLNTPSTMRFDFTWNYTIGARQTRYSRELPVTSDVLVGDERGQCLNFKTPFVLMPGEQMTFVVQSTLFYGAVGDVAHTAVEIAFALLGYREDDL